jgi:hypothetical protein
MILLVALYGYETLFFSIRNKHRLKMSHVKEQQAEDKIWT